MATCTCPSIDCTQSTIEGVVYCTCTTIIPNIQCNEGGVIQILPDGNAVCVYVDQVEPTITPTVTPVYFNDEDYFEDVSWTLSYNPITGSFVSYHDFKPDYYIGYQNYFSTGLNFYKNTEWTETLSSHLLTNKSYNVFYGEKFPFIAEIVVKNEYVTKVLDSVKVYLEAKRYQNEWDYAVNKNIGFSHATLYNSTNNSGRLNLFIEKTLNSISKYPRTNSDSQDIQTVVKDEKQIFNYFYNRVKNEENNVEIWHNDKVRINKILNPHAVSFKGKKTLERMRGDYFLLRLEFTDTQHSLTLKNTLQEVKIE